MGFSILAVGSGSDWRASLRRSTRGGAFAIVDASDVPEAGAALAGSMFHLVLLDEALVSSGAPESSGWRELAGRFRASVPFALVSRSGTAAVLPPFVGSVDSRRGLARSVLDLLRERYAEQAAPRHRLLVVHSGGDAAGMNAATLAVAAEAEQFMVEVLGGRDGYRGLVKGRLEVLRRRDLFAHARRPGSFLGSARFEAFKDPSVRCEAARVLLDHHIEFLVVIGGDGSTRGALALADEVRALGGELRLAVVPGTMDNDIVGCDRTLGAASAVSALVRALDELVPPAEALGRIFVTEAMGRNTGWVALRAAASLPAEGVLLPELLVKIDSARGGPWRDAVDCRETARAIRSELNRILERAEAAFRRGQRHASIVVGEGIRLLTRGKIDVDLIARYIERKVRRWPADMRPDVRTHVVGHRARGVLADEDQQLGLRLGRAAARAVLAGRHAVMVGWSETKGVVYLPCSEVIAASDLPPAELWARRPRWEAELQQFEALVSVEDPRARGA